MLLADPVFNLEPGSAAWQREMTASKVAAVLGLSPWESRFSLWYRMAGRLEDQPETKAMTRGHYLEDAVCRWVADQYNLGTLLPGLCWRNHARPWQVASPDRLVAIGYDGAGIYPERATAVVEAKTAADWEHWGPDGSDEIPVYYRTQAVWQCDTLGVDTAYVGVLLPRLEFRGYVIHPAPGEADFIREEVRAFLDTLAAGDPPDVDRHDRTYEVLRTLNPDLAGGQIEVPWDVAHEFALAYLATKEAELNWTYQRSLMAQRMGTAKEAAHDGRVVAVRTPAPKTGVPYVGATRSKKTLAVLAEVPAPTEETP